MDLEPRIGDEKSISHSWFQRMDEWKSFDLIIGEVLDQEKI